MNIYELQIISGSLKCAPTTYEHKNNTGNIQAANRLL